MLQTIKIDDNGVTAYYKGTPVARVTSPAKIMAARNLAALAGDAAAADYIITAGEEVGK